MKSNTNQIGNLCAFAILLAQYLMRTAKMENGGSPRPSWCSHLCEA